MERPARLDKQRHPVQAGMITEGILGDVKGGPIHGTVSR